ncbi:MAG: polyprenol monophosphomannose synthase [Anaerolineaceae bacterium]|nr:polyprenol monophosphomannose synthase [Anaerolineaceae bacterium]
MKITIVVPTYNEAENLPKLVAEVLALPLPDLSMLIVDDNSPDGTGQMAEELGQQYAGRIKVMHREGKLGLGTAYMQGFQFAIEDGAEAIGQMDADFSHPIDKIVVMAETLQSCDAVIGSRYVPGGSLDERWPLWRKALSGWGNFYARTILSLPIRDVTGGFRLWRRETLLGMPLERVRSNGYVFQVEMNYIAQRLGYVFKEIPIYFQDRRFGESKMSFKIQMEAAIRTWQLPGMYKDLPKLKK